MQGCGDLHCRTGIADTSIVIPTNEKNLFRFDRHRIGSFAALRMTSGQTMFLVMQKINHKNSL